MASIVVSGDTSGAVTITAPAIAGTTTLTLPTTSGTIVTTGGAASLTTSGNLTFTGTGNRITGDFSNATLSNRVAFQTSTTNSGARIGILPNGTGTATSIDAYGNSDPTNTAFGRFGIIGSSEVVVQSNISGSGTYLPLTMYTGGSERLRIDTSGNVGIGTSAPGAGIRLDVAAAESVIRCTSTTGTNASYQLFGNTGGSLYVGRDSSGGGLTGAAYSNVLLGTGAYPMVFATNSAERMRIDSSGNVGIGTSSPNGRLNLVNSSANGVQLRIDNTSQSSQYLSITMMGATGFSVPGWDNSAVIEAVADVVGSGTRGLYLSAYNGPMIFATNGRNERMRITSGGELLVGTTTTTDNSRLAVSQTGNNTCIAALTTSTGGSSVYRAVTNQSSMTGMAFYTSTSTFAGAISSSGSSTTYGTSSDYRLKENVAPMTGALTKVAQLKPCTYTWKVDGSQGEGFIAHELAEVVPQAVTGEKDAVNEDGSIKPQGVDTSFLVATLTAAIQELNAKVEAQAAEIQALKGAQ